MQGTLIRYKNYGTNDPFMARMFFGVLKLRDFIIKEEQARLEFDNLYVPIQESLEEAYEAHKKCLELISSHTDKVESGEIISFQGADNEIINVNESVDREVGKNIKDFFIKGEIGIRATFPLYKHFGYKISFLKKDDEDFELGCDKFLTENKGEKFEGFIEMIRKERAWYSNFNKIRRKIEHQGFVLPSTKYVKNAQGEVQAIFPMVDNISIPEYLSRMWNSLFLFSEDLVVSLIGFELRPPLIISYIPEELRDKTMPLRYDIWAEGLTEFLEKQKLEEVK